MMTAMGSVPAPSAGRRFGKYTLVARLATGGMAEIFLARLQGEAGFEKLVCIKQILPHLARDQQFVAMFLDEARTAARISHPHVCQVFELGQLDGRYYIAMEYLEGVPLACFRRADMYRMPPEPRLVVGMAVQACEGLHHAHQLKGPDGAPLEVVHRDVSPNNLFVTVDGVVKVLDFGIAKVQDASVRTSTGAVKGTYAYMAPEQLRGEPLDRRTDVFAMGIVVWELFAQRYLFKRDTDFLTFQAITNDPIPDICELRPDLPPALGDAIAMAMSRDREGRFPTVRAFGEALANTIAPIGGALPASAISDEVARAFHDTLLREQANLVQLARSGGALDLEDDSGLPAGHGTELVTTPVSSMRPPRPTRREIPAVEAVPRTLPPAPAPPPRRALRITMVALVALGLGAGGMYWWSQRDKDPAAAVVPPPQPAVAVDAAVVTVAPRDAAPIVVDAAVVASTPTIDAAVTQPDKHTPKPPPPPPKPTGPPGFITIDSAPVYAVIFVDGRRMGETPLVHIELAPGKHGVRAVSPSGTAQSLTITIESGKTAPTRRIEW
jgi:serine/threonine-protein kinase